MVDALAVVALAQLVTDQARHHAADPLLADDGVLGLLERDGVVVVDAVEGGRDGGLLGEEGGRLGDGHLGRGRWLFVAREEMPLRALHAHWSMCQDSPP